MTDKKVEKINSYVVPIIVSVFSDGSMQTESANGQVLDLKVVELEYDKSKSNIEEPTPKVSYPTTKCLVLAFDTRELDIKTAVRVAASAELLEIAKMVKLTLDNCTHDLASAELKTMASNVAQLISGVNTVLLWKMEAKPNNARFVLMLKTLLKGRGMTLDYLLVPGSK